MGDEAAQRNSLRSAQRKHANSVRGLVEELDVLDAQMRRTLPDEITPYRFARIRASHVKLFAAIRNFLNATADFVEGIHDDGNSQGNHRDRNADEAD
jgi:hypothetical protein